MAKNSPSLLVDFVISLMIIFSMNRTIISFPVTHLTSYLIKLLLLAEWVVTIRPLHRFAWIKLRDKFTILLTYNCSATSLVFDLLSTHIT